jgi:hypothetical protein
LPPLGDPVLAAELIRDALRDAIAMRAPGGPPGVLVTGLGEAGHGASGPAGGGLAGAVIARLACEVRPDCAVLTPGPPGSPDVALGRRLAGAWRAGYQGRTGLGWRLPGGSGGWSGAGCRGWTGPGRRPGSSCGCRSLICLWSTWGCGFLVGCGTGTGCRTGCCVRRSAGCFLDMCWPVTGMTGSIGRGVRPAAPGLR